MNNITGVQINLSVMSDDYVNVILSSLDQVDTTHVLINTDDVSTHIEGQNAHVFDVVKAIYLNAAQTGHHVEMSGTFVIGCPSGNGKVDEDTSREQHEVLNEQQSKSIAQQAGCRFALYPLGDENYMQKIVEQIDLIKESNVSVSESPIQTRLDGEVNDIFNVLETSFDQIRKVVNHTVMTFTISCNSPSSK